jgi:hypothetical protein
MRHTHDTGRAGEFLAAYILETFGVECHHVDRDGADLWCKVRGTLVGVEVKTSREPRTSRADRGSVVRYSFYTSRLKDAPWHCFVALDRQLLLMRVTAGLPRTTHIAPSEFNEVSQRRTVEEFLADPLVDSKQGEG